MIRDGNAQRIAGRDVVRGDLVVLGEGDRVPADAMLVEASDLSADEVDPHGQVGSGAQARSASRRRALATGRRRSTASLFEHAGDPRTRPLRGDRNWGEERDWPHRPSA